MRGRKTEPTCYIVSMSKSSTRRHSRPRARIVSSRTVYRGPVFWVSTDHVQEPGGIRVRRDLVHHSGSVVVLAVDDSGKTPRVLLSASCWKRPATPPTAGGAFCISTPAPDSSPRQCQSIWQPACTLERLTRKKTRSSTRNLFLCLPQSRWSSMEPFATPRQFLPSSGSITCPETHAMPGETFPQSSALKRFSLGLYRVLPILFLEQL
jgi:hypothetical protein